MSIVLPFIASQLSEIPVLETERLLLRGYRPDDLVESAAMSASPEFYRYLGGEPISKEEAWRRILIQQGHWSLMGYGFWAVEEKSTGLYSGSIGFGDFNRDITPSISGMPEMGWVLAPRVHGRGYATEAVRAALAWGEQHFHTPQTVCIIDPDNVASLRVAHKFGYQQTAHTTYKQHPILILTRPQGISVT
ncbi:GNAT family N-acetyltransferase [Hymenobacter tibetensis]|uniref:GNAT family N-acetyltransferase n=1 Tax=Hymenobacter tibetensis TaxID=497967 RepID=A0ABY4D408_9BACT|nr:GNAT family N-acetyltransferase [Hymenobacter tibetensis]UOG77165.1 GNAT family N-acetyltransferase [Hymenobacter tibetensis]